MRTLMLVLRWCSFGFVQERLMKLLENRECRVIAQEPTVPSCQRRALCFLLPLHILLGCIAMNRDKTREHCRSNSWLCFCNCCGATFAEVS